MLLSKWGFRRFAPHELWCAEDPSGSHVRVWCWACSEPLGKMSVRTLDLGASHVAEQVEAMMLQHLAKYAPTLSDLTDWGWFDAEASA